MILYFYWSGFGVTMDSIGLVSLRFGWVGSGWVGVGLIWFGCFGLILFDLWSYSVVGLFRLGFFRSGSARPDFCSAEPWARFGLDRVLPGCSAATVVGLSPFSLLTVDRKPARPVFVYRCLSSSFRRPSLSFRLVTFRFDVFRFVSFSSFSRTVSLYPVSLCFGSVRFGSVGSWVFRFVSLRFASLRYVSVRYGPFRIRSVFCSPLSLAGSSVIYFLVSRHDFGRRTDQV